MKHLFHSHMTQLPRLRYLTTLMAVVVVAALVMTLTTATAHASTPTTPTLMGSSVLTGVAIPNSAEGCNQKVCIAVCNNAICGGRGTYIDYVTSVGYDTSKTGCSVGQMLVRGGVREQTNVVCWSNGPNTVEVLSSFYPVGYNINSGSQVCVKYIRGPSGEPCETVR